MKKISQSYLALKHDVVTMGLPYPFLKGFSVVHKTHGAGTVAGVYHGIQYVLVSFVNKSPSCSIKVDELFDLSGDWVVHFGELALRSVEFKALFERRRTELMNSFAKILERQAQWDLRYGRKSRLLLAEEAKVLYMKKITDQR